MKDKKAKYLLLVIAGLTMLSLISIKQIVLFKPRETVNKTQKEIYSREINPQTKPEDVVKILNMEDPTYREAEVINNGYKDGAFSIDLKLIYPDALIVRTLKMVIEDE